MSNRSHKDFKGEKPEKSESILNSKRPSAIANSAYFPSHIHLNSDSNCNDNSYLLNNNNNNNINNISNLHANYNNKNTNENNVLGEPAAKDKSPKNLLKEIENKKRGSRLILKKKKVNLNMNFDEKGIAVNDIKNTEEGDSNNNLHKIQNINNFDSNNETRDKNEPYSNSRNLINYEENARNASANRNKGENTDANVLNFNDVKIDFDKEEAEAQEEQRDQ